MGLTYDDPRLAALTLIRIAAEYGLSLTVDEMPTLVVHARNIEKIPDVVKTAAAELLGWSQQDFDVKFRY